MSISHVINLECDNCHRSMFFDSDSEADTAVVAYRWAKAAFDNADAHLCRECATSPPLWWRRAVAEPPEKAP